MSDTIVRKLAATLGIQTDTKSFETADKAITGVKDKLTGIAGTAGFGNVISGLSGISAVLGKIGAGGAGAIVAVAGAGAALMKSAKAVAEQAGNINKNVAISGIDSDRFQELAYGAKQSGLEMQDLGLLMGKLQRSMFQGKKGSSEQGQDFKRLGISVTDAAGKMRPAGSVIEELAGKLEGLDAAEKQNVARNLLGKSYAQAMPWLNKGAKGFKEMSNEAHVFGHVLDKETLGRAKEFSKSKKQIAAVWEGLELQLGAAVLPFLTDLSKGLAGFTVGILPAVKMATGLWTGEMVSGLKLIQGALTPVTFAFTSLEEVIKNIAGLAGADFGGPLTAGIKAFTRPITEAYDTLQDMVFFLAGKGSAIGLSLAKNKAAYAAAAEKDPNARFSLTGEVLKPGEAGGVGGVFQDIGRAIESAPLIGGDVKNITQSLAEGNFMSTLAEGWKMRLGFSTVEESRARLGLGPQFSPPPEMPMLYSGSGGAPANNVSVAAPVLNLTVNSTSSPEQIRTIVGEAIQTQWSQAAASVPE